MKKFYIVMSALLMQAGMLIGQTYMVPEGGYRVADFLSEYSLIGAFDIKGDRVYIQDGDSIHVVDAGTGEELATYGEPADYTVTNYASFLTVSPDEKSIWAGYTSDGNADDRIYCIDMESGTWSLKARFPGNYDLNFWKDSILVSGLNSATWGDPNGIFVLDTSGLNQHSLIINVGGNSAGMALDTSNNLYYGTSYSMDPNGIYRFNLVDLEAVIESPGSDPLQMADGVKLTDVPAGVSDCEIDGGFNLVFAINLFGSPKVLAMFNGAFDGGDGYLFDTLAVASGEWDWLGSVKSMGDFTRPNIGERLVTFSFGKTLVDLHTADYAPFVANPLGEFILMSDGRDTVIDLSQLFSDPDDPNDSIAKVLLSNSNEELLEASISGNDLTLRGKLMLLKSMEDEIEVVVEGISGGQTVQDTLKVTLDWPGGIFGPGGADFSLYPNPSQGSFVVSYSGPEPLDLTILSITGTRMYSNPHYVSGQMVDIQSLPAGPYLVRIKKDDNVFTTLIQKL